MTIENLKISKSKKSERYFRDKLEIFIRLLHEYFARHFDTRRDVILAADCTTDFLGDTSSPLGEAMETLT